MLPAASRPTPKVASPTLHLPAERRASVSVLSIDWSATGFGAPRPVQPLPVVFEMAAPTATEATWATAPWTRKLRASSGVMSFSKTVATLSISTVPPPLGIAVATTSPARQPDVPPSMRRPVALSHCTSW